MPNREQYEALRRKHREWRLRPWEELPKADREMTLYEFTRDRGRRAQAQVEMAFPTESRDFYPGHHAKHCPVCGETPRLCKRDTLPYPDTLIPSLGVVWYAQCRCVAFPWEKSAEAALRAWNLAQALATPA